MFHSRLVSLNEVQDWLKTVPTVNLEPVKCGSISLDEPVVEAIERVVEQSKVISNLIVISSLVVLGYAIVDQLCVGR